jgi:putative ATP-dependent endonuclease of OLD family
MPRTIAADDLRITTEGDLAGDPLAGVTITISDGDTAAPLAEQSDGVRALSVLAILGMSQRSARIVGIDEPETHLHTTAQRTIGRSLARNEAQTCVATHSAAIVSQLNPLDIVAFGADRRARQLPVEAEIAEAETVTRHWSARLLDPLTARCIILVEGPADRIVLDRLAELAQVNLDRVGAVIFELDGGGFFATAYRFFGKPGFDLPLLGMLDDDYRTAWAHAMGIEPAILEDEGFVVCDPDLEAAYVQALGCEAVVSALTAAGFTEANIVSQCGVADVATVNEEALAGFCRHKRRKVRAALAITEALHPSDTASFPTMLGLIQQAADLAQ